MYRFRIPIAVTGVLVAVLALSACATTSTPNAPGASSQQFNNADVSFASGMAAHHQQAIDMAQVVLDKTGIDPQVIALAQEIKAAQGPEITQMTGWLTSWGHKPQGMSGMDMSGTLMSDADMNALKNSTGITASKLFLTEMTTHHTSALSMAKTEIDKGRYPAAITLAKKIVTTQTAEIAKMSDILTML